MAVTMAVTAMATGSRPPTAGGGAAAARGGPGSHCGSCEARAGVASGAGATAVVGALTVGCDGQGGEAAVATHLREQLVDHHETDAEAAQPRGRVREPLRRQPAAVAQLDGEIHLRPEPRARALDGGAAHLSRREEGLHQG